MTSFLIRGVTHEVQIFFSYKILPSIGNYSPLTPHKNNVIFFFLIRYKLSVQDMYTFPMVTYIIIEIINWKLLSINPT